MTLKLYEYYQGVLFGFWLFRTTFEWWLWTLENPKYSESQVHRLWERLNDE